MTIDSDFPGGNIVVDRIEGDDVYLHQDLRGTAIPWFYWCFRLRGAAGRRIRFHFTTSAALGVRGPALSTDAGRTWSWLGPEAGTGSSFLVAVPADVPELRLSFGMPYQADRWDRFVDSLPQRDTLEPGILCTTETGRPAPCLTLGEAPAEHHVVVTCRHHACEMMANYALEGLVAWLVKQDEQEAVRLRRRTAFLFIPFIDFDGVEAGDQGKARAPRDHGRDYEGPSLYRTTAALRRLLPTWSGNRLHVGLDLHCPHIRGGHNETLYLVGSPNPRMETAQREFSRHLQNLHQGPIPVHADHFLPFGTAWNTEANYVDGKGFAQWLSERPEALLATGLEIPYANADGVEVNQNTAHRLGRDIGRTLDAFLATRSSS